MSVYCQCDFGDDAEWYWDGEKTGKLAAKNSRRCRSCKEKLTPGTEVRILGRFREPQTDLEDRIHGAEVPLEPGYLCLPCADLWDALIAVNACPDWTRPFAEEVAELNKDYAPAGFRLKTKTAMQELEEGV